MDSNDWLKGFKSSKEEEKPEVIVTVEKEVTISEPEKDSDEKKFSKLANIILFLKIISSKILDHARNKQDLNIDELIKYNDEIKTFLEELR
jgi:hypothetical protein